MRARWDRARCPRRACLCRRSAASPPCLGTVSVACRPRARCLLARQCRWAGAGACSARRVLVRSRMVSGSRTHARTGTFASLAKPSPNVIPVTGNATVNIATDTRTRVENHVPESRSIGLGACGSLSLRASREDAGIYRDAAHRYGRSAHRSAHRYGRHRGVSPFPPSPWVRWTVGWPRGWPVTG